MSFSVTALQLVNRVQRRRRQPDKSVIATTDVEALATLDAVNKAIRNVLNERTWEFNNDRRSQLATKAPTSGITASAGGSSTIILTDGKEFDATDFPSDNVTRFLPGGSSGFSDTSFRINTYNFLLGDAFCTTPLDDVPSFSTTEGKLFYAEYLLPETVKSVTRVTYQETPISLHNIEPTVEYHETLPRPSMEFNEPSSVSVGGLDIGGYATGGTAPNPALRMVIWPIPDGEYVLDYSYEYRHPELTSETSTLDGVPPEVVDLVVDFATTDMQMNWDRLFNEGRALRSDAMGELGDIHKRHKGQRSRRSAVGNWDGYASNHSRRGNLYRKDTYEG